MSTAESPAAPVAFRDQKTGLVIYGIFQIALGCFCVLVALAMAAMAMLPPPAVQGPKPPTVPGYAAAVYLLPAIVFIWLGIGSILARRWAWALTLVLSWIWLIGGLLGLVCFLIVMPLTMSAAAEQAKMPPQAMLVMQVVMGGFMSCAYVLLPAAFLLFYQRAAVRETCRQRDPKTRWTDGCPLPVLAGSVLQMAIVACLPFAAIYRFVAPLFGVLIVGTPAAVILLAVAVLLAYLAWGFYRLKMAAWWTVLLFCIVGSVSNVLNALYLNPIEMYEKMGMPAEQLEIYRKMGTAQMSLMMWWAGLLGAAVWIGYLVFVRRYFVRREMSIPPGSQSTADSTARTDRAPPAGTPGP